MKRREVAGNSSIRTFIRGVYKAFGFWSGKLKTRFFETGVRNDSWGFVIYKNGIVKEIVTW